MASSRPVVRLILSNGRRQVCAIRIALLVAVCAPLLAVRGQSDLPKTSARAELWVDTVRSEPVAFDEMIDELRTSRVVYLGEVHSIPRHHQLQLNILNELTRRGARVVLAMEQFEYMAQPALDQFNARAITLDALAAQAQWDKRWKAHTNYHGLLNLARSSSSPVLALNARAETIRAVGRQGLSGITREQREELPPDLIIEDPVYERLATRLLGVHMAFDLAKLHPIFEAQVARDETMAARLVTFLSAQERKEHLAVVICGRGHCEYGLGMPDRVARRLPGIAQRIVLFSESGDLHLTEEERKQARETNVPHQFLRDLGRLPADYVHVISPAE